MNISIATGFPACAGPEDIDCVVEVKNPGSQACFGTRHGNPDRAGGCVYGGGNRTGPPAGVERITYSSAHGDTCEGRRNFSPSGWTLEKSWSSVAAALMDCTLTLNYGWDGVGEHPTFVSFERQIRVRRERKPNGSFGESTYTAWSNFVPAGPTRTSTGFFACQGSVQERNGLYEIYFFSTSTYLEPYAIRDGAGSDRDLLEVVSITPPPGVTPDYDFENADLWNLDYKGLSQSWSGKVAAPGRYSMTYRVYVNGGEQDATCSVVAGQPAPTPVVGVRMAHDNPADTTGRFALNEEFDVIVTAGALDDATGNITGAQLDVTKLFNQAPNIEVLSGPTPAITNPLTLVPGATTQKFTYRVKAVAPGRFRLDVKLTSMISAAGDPVPDLPFERYGSVGAIEVAAAATPDVVDLEEGDDGPKPKPVTVKVTVTNPFDSPMTDVKLVPLEPRLVVNRPPPLNYSAFNYLVDGQPGIPAEVTLGTIEAKQKKEYEFVGSAINAGSIDLEFLARGLSDGSAIAGAVTTRVEIVTDVDFVFDASVDDSSTGSGPEGSSGVWVIGGETWMIDGSFENRTLDKTLLVFVQPDRRGNAGFGVPIPEGTTPPDAECGIGVAHIVEAGKSIDFVAPVPTTQDGANRSEIRYQPQVFELNDDGTRTAIDSARVLITPGSDAVKVSVDTREPRTTEPSYGELSLVYSLATVQAIYDTAAGLASLSIEAFGRGVQFWTWPDAYLAAGDKVAEYLVNVEKNLSPADREAWLNDWSSALAIATGQSLTDARALVDDQVLSTFTELNTAWETGDSRSVAAWWGKLTGENIDTVLGGVTKAYGICKLIKSRTFAKNALARAETQLAKNVADTAVTATAKTFPTGGIIDRAARRRIWGIDDVMHAKVQAFVDDFNIVIGVRRRGPGSIAKIELETHIPKPYHNKAKNVSQIDKDYLGFTGELDTASIKKPPLQGDLDLSGLSSDLRADVLARHKTRMEEWYGKGVDLKTGTGGDIKTSEIYKWTQYATPGNGIPVPRKGAPLDYTQNVNAGRSVPPDDVLYRKAPAQLQETILADGSSQFTLKIDIEGNGQFKPSTGDMDPVIVSNPDFSAMSEIERIKFYERAYELGFEHVESASWNNPAGRNGYLEDHSVYNPDAEALYTWMPKQQARATRFDPQKSWSDPADLRLEATLIYLRGANVHLKTSKSVVGDVDVSGVDEDAAYTSPKTIFFVEKDCGSPRGAARLTAAQLTSGLPTVASLTSACTVSFDRGDDSVILRQTALGGIEVWSEADGWTSFAGSAASASIGVLPQTVITDDAAAGASRVEIASQTDLGTESSDEWFEPGDVVVIDPGGSNQEVATIAGFGSLIFSEPLANAHRAGTMVSVLRPASAPVVTDPPVTTTLPPPGPTTPPTIPMAQLPATGGGGAGPTLVVIGLLLIALGGVLVSARRRPRVWIH